MPGATACPQCGRPAPPKSALTEQKDIDATQFISLPPGALLPEEREPPAPAGTRRRPLLLAVALGLLAGALLLLVIISLTHARH